MTDTAPNGRRYSPVQCSGRAAEPLPLLPPTPPPPGPYKRDELSYAEAAVLTRAVRTAGESLDQASAAIRTASAALVSAWHETGAALERLELFQAGQRLGHAGAERRAVVEAHRHDGPEDRRAQPWWHREPVVWTMILLAAVYDTYFFATTFQDALDTDPNGPWYEQAIAYIPGVSIAIALVLAGYLLSESLSRHRSRAERRPVRGRLNWRIVFRRTFVEWRPEEQRRSPNDLPWPSWPLAIGFTLLVVGVLGLWAWLRGADPDVRDVTVQWPMVALLVLLTMSAIMLKAVSNNSFARRDARSRTELTAARVERDALEVAARQRIAELTDAWYRLQAVLDDALAVARRQFTDAWAQIAEERERHQRTGAIAPAFTSGEGSIGGEVYQGLTVPALPLQSLENGREALDRYAPKTAEDRLDRILKLLMEQLRKAMGSY
ncbi:hypothetical protein AB0M02_04925 [Actinoplanes sp. NPDC051861]|uniref:hypothetical protein n=1 Tax=Actinoplanes sp. NPDC051861 TaxID=3155170 RepID=UPI00343BDAB3